MRSLLVVLPFVVASVNGQHVLATVYGSQAAGYTGDRVEPAGDMDGDQVPDWLVSSPYIGNGRLHVISGANLSVRNLDNPGPGGFAQVLFACPDMNQDGVRDIVVSRGGTLMGYSGATLTQLWQTVASNYTVACPIGDIDNDGRCDLAAISYASGNYTLSTLRGLNGSPIAAITVNYGAAMIMVGDLDGDGRAEIAKGGNNIEVYHTSPLALMSSTGGTCMALAAANMAGDARNELIAADGYLVRVINAVTGAVLRTFSGAANAEFGVIGDLNADGVPDLALRATPGTLGDAVEFVSGVNGSLLSLWTGTVFVRCVELAAVGDVDGDGYGDLVIGDHDATPVYPATTRPGGWQLLSGKVLATMTSKPTNCGQGPFLPTLGITRPILGMTAMIEGRDAPPGTVGFLAFSPQPAVATNLGVVGCDAWFDVSNGFLLAQPGGTQWQIFFPVPAAPQLAGFAFALQAFYAPTLSPIGIDVTNGVWARFGY